jgi:hypothetical protein
MLNLLAIKPRAIFV